MSQEYAWPGAWRRDGEAGEAVVRRCELGLGEVGPALALGGFPQAFDFAVCGVAAASVLPRVFFPDLAPAAALAAALGVWMLAYVAAWLARPAVAAVDRICGPRLRLILARVLFTVATTMIALLPAAAQAPWSPWLLVAVRLVQGVALAGLSHGRLAPQLSPAAERRARLKVWTVSGVVGLCLAGGLMGALAFVLQGPDLVAWGWRYPYVIALALNISGLVGDLNAEAEGRARRPKGRAHIRLATVGGAPVGPRQS